jgi:chorismate synthase
VEVLAGLRHGRTLGTPLALVVRNRDHKNWTWGMSPWPPEGEPAGKGTKAVTLPRPGHADLAGVQKFGHGDVRDALERASARHTAVHVAAGAVAKALLAAIGVSVFGEALPEAGADPAAVDEARAVRDTLGGVVEVRARGVPPGLGSYARKEDRLDARLAAALMGIQAVKGVEIGDGFALARLRGSEAHDEIVRDERGLHRETNRAGGVEAGVSNGEEIVVRAAMKPLPTLMQPLASVDLQTGEPAQALVERSDVSAVEALAVVAEAAVAWELARAAREKFGGDALGDFVAAWRAYVERIDWRGV